ncbi:MAG TPA: acyltransferase [Acidimicrobiia bacterium]|nr:acyltransferase [Acidimicrobiia bacterium]
MPSGFIHPTALVESRQVGDGTRVWAFAHIMEGAVVGRDCKIGDHAFIEAGAVLGDRVTVKNSSLVWEGVTIGSDVFVGPNVVFTNDDRPRAYLPFGPEQLSRTVVDPGASIGANSTILAGIRLGSYCMVGAGSVVTRDVPNHALVLGNPARQRGWVCTCRGDISDGNICSACGARYRTVGSGLRLVDHAANE